MTCASPLVTSPALECEDPRFSNSTNTIRKLNARLPFVLHSARAPGQHAIDCMAVVGHYPTAITTDHYLADAHYSSHVSPARAPRLRVCQGY